MIEQEIEIETLLIKLAWNNWIISIVANNDIGTKLLYIIKNVTKLERNDVVDSKIEAGELEATE